MFLNVFRDVNPLNRCTEQWKMWLNKNVYNTSALDFGFHLLLVLSHAGGLQDRHIMHVLWWPNLCGRLGECCRLFCWRFDWKQTSQIKTTESSSLHVIIPMQNEAIALSYLSWFSSGLYLHFQPDWVGSARQALHGGINSHLQGHLFYTKGKPSFKNSPTACV